MRIDNVARLDNGALRVDGYLTRTGVLDYAMPDGSVIKEMREPEEVFEAASLSSLEDKPVTDDHPNGFVNVGNWSALAKGHVSAGSVGRDGDFVKASLVITDPDVITRVEQKKLREISCGYDCEIADEPGEGFDRKQKSIRYNHVALGPENWGRAGREVRLRLDSTGNQVEPDSHQEEKMASTETRIDAEAVDKNTTEKESYDAESAIKELTDSMKKIVDRLNGLEEKLKEDSGEDEDEKKKDEDKEKEGKTDSVNDVASVRASLLFAAKTAGFSCRADASNASIADAVLKELGASDSLPSGADKVTAAIVAASMHKADGASYGRPVAHVDSQVGKSSIVIPEVNIGNAWERR